LPTYFEFQVDPAKLRIDIGMPVHTGFIPYPTAAALMDTVREMMLRRFTVRHISPVGSSIVTDARSAVVDQFLKGDGTHLFWIDSDMHWHPRWFLKLVALCTQVDVVGATYTQKTEPPRFMLREPKNTINPWGLIEVAGLGLGFTIMRREVVEKVAASKPMIHTNGGELREVFAFGRTPEGHRLGEDMAFFQDIREAGYTVWMDPKVNVQHVGLKMYGGDVMAALGGANAGA
jgi:hypothetical protein